MEDVGVWILWVAIIVGSIVSSVLKAKKKRDEAAARTSIPARPAVAPPVAATSNDYYSLETEYNAEDWDYDRRNGYSAEKEYGAGNRFDAEIAAYEKLATERARRSTYDPARKQDRGQADAGNDVAADGDPGIRLEDVLGGEFDLRRAVIEAEILTPKFGRY